VEESRDDQQLVEEEAEQNTVSLSVDDFSALEARIIRAVDLVRKERLARADAEERAARAESDLREQAPLIESLQKELVSLRSERDYVRQRVERLLSQFDALEV
jgi:FtsZ-binding cell division protein ZapB